MSKNTDEFMNSAWKRKIMNFYWAVFMTSLAAELWALFLNIHYQLTDLHHFIQYKLLLPSVSQLLVIIASEVIIRRVKRTNPYFIISTGTALVTILIAANPAINGIEYLLIMPMIVALFFYERRKLIFALILNGTILGVLYATFPRLIAGKSLYDLYAIVFALAGGYFLLDGLISRGKELKKRLTHSVKSEQELLIRTVIMDRQMKFDALTDLYNHKTFHEYLDHLTVQSDKYNLPLQLAIVDIDNFKKVNDTYGHAVGDLILQRVAQVIKQSLQNSDDIAARYGGEEFAVIFTDKPAEHSLVRIELIRTQIESLCHHEMNGKNVTISVGLATYRPGSGKAALFSEADAMLYTAKRSGKNRTITELQHSAM